MILKTDIRRTPSVNETVKATEASLKTKHAKGLINAVLRKIIDHPETLNINPLDAQYPSWWVKSLKKAYPANLHQILEANLRPSKMFLRVNRQKISRIEYTELLKKEQFQYFRNSKAMARYSA
jgi:16S rRNA (cytosine967-C5)-methyltransferase